jgi:thiol-disulfide isomerase/thioredoxin
LLLEELKLNFFKIIFLTTLLCVEQGQSYAEELRVGSNSGFTLKDTSGKTHRLSDYRGKWVFVNFWATWCPPCLEEIPDLVSFYDARKKRDVVVLGVVLDFSSTQEVTKYVDDMLMSYPIVYGDDNVIKQFWHADVLPTTYIYNPRGDLVKIKRGLVTQQYLKNFIN